MAETQGSKNGNGNRNQDTARRGQQQQQPGQRGGDIARQGRAGELARTGGFGGWGLSDPFGMMRSLYDDIDRVFQRFGMSAPGIGRFGGLENIGGGAIAQQGVQGTWMPQMEVFRRDGEVVVRTDLPGLERDDVDIELDERNQQLVIRGERKQAREWDENGVLHSERSYGNFYRALPLPEDVKSESCKATFKNGVLEVTLKTDEKKTQRARRIEIGE